MTTETLVTITWILGSIAFLLIVAAAMAGASKKSGKKKSGKKKFGNEHLVNPMLPGVRPYGITHYEPGSLTNIEQMLGTAPKKRRD